MVLRASHTPLNFGDFERALGFSIGFDSMFDRLLGDSTQYVTNNQGFPPYNIRKDGEIKYFIEMAVAGLSEEDLEVELKESVLQIRSKQSTDDEAIMFIVGLPREHLKGLLPFQMILL